MKRSLFLLSVLIIVIGPYYLYNRFSYAQPRNFIYDSTSLDSTLKIGIIGDSWVESKKLDTILRNELLAKNIPALIFSSGHGGAKSKLVYENLHLDSTKAHSSNKMFYKNLDYCVILNGVNDVMQRMGPEFYSHHQLMIIRDMLKHKIKPVIVTLPEFGVVEANNNLNVFSRIRNKLLGLYSNNGKLNNIREYRKVLMDSLGQTALLKSITIVDFDSVIVNYNNSKMFYINPPHLNRNGNAKLARYIARCISADL